MNIRCWIILNENVFVSIKNQVVDDMIYQNVTALEAKIYFKKGKCAHKVVEDINRFLKPKVIIYFKIPFNKVEVYPNDLLYEWVRN